MIKSVGFIPYEFGSGLLSDTYGGQQLTLTISQSIVDDLKWLSEYRKQLEREQQLRRENETVRSAWEQYQTVLNLVVLDVEKP